MPAADYQLVPARSSIGSLMPPTIKTEPDLLTKTLRAALHAELWPRSQSCLLCSGGWLMDYSNPDNPTLKPCYHGRSEFIAGTHAPEIPATNDLDQIPDPCPKCGAKGSHGSSFKTCGSFFNSGTEQPGWHISFLCGHGRELINQRSDESGMECATPLSLNHPPPKTMNTPHAENATESAARIAKEDADRQKNGQPAYTAAERSKVESDRAAAVQAAADKAGK